MGDVEVKSGVFDANKRSTGSKKLLNDDVLSLLHRKMSKEDSGNQGKEMTVSTLKSQVIQKTNWTHF